MSTEDYAKKLGDMFANFGIKKDTKNDQKSETKTEINTSEKSYNVNLRFPTLDGFFTWDTCQQVPYGYQGDKLYKFFNCRLKIDTKKYQTNDLMKRIDVNFIEGTMKIFDIDSYELISMNISLTL